MVRVAVEEKEESTAKSASNALNGDTLPVARHLDYDALISEQGVVTVRKGHTLIVIVAERSPTWAWYVGALGSIKWLVGT